MLIKMMYNKCFYHSFFCENKNQNIKKYFLWKNLSKMSTHEKRPVWNVLGQNVPSTLSIQGLYFNSNNNIKRLSIYLGSTLGPLSTGWGGGLGFALVVGWTFVGKVFPPTKGKKIGKYKQTLRKGQA